MIITSNLENFFWCPFLHFCNLLAGDRCLVGKPWTAMKIAKCYSKASECRVEWTCQLPVYHSRDKSREYEEQTWGCHLGIGLDGWTSLQTILENYFNKYIAVELHEIWPVREVIVRRRRRLAYHYSFSYTTYKNCKNADTYSKAILQMVPHRFRVCFGFVIACWNEA